MRSRWFGLVIAALAVAVSIWAYPSLPPRVATHWDLRGTPDGFSSRLMAVLIGPLVIGALTLLFNVLPKVDGYFVRCRVSMGNPSPETPPRRCLGRRDVTTTRRLQVRMELVTDRTRLCVPEALTHPLNAGVVEPQRLAD